MDSVWDHLGTFVDAYDKLGKIFIEEEANAKKVYKGDESLARRALRRIQIRTQLDAMLAEMREEMVYNTPPELGDVWTRFEAMWGQIVKEQNEAQAEELRKAQVAEWRRGRAIEDLKAKAVWIGAVVFVLAWGICLMILLRMSHTYRGAFSSPWWSCVLC